MANKRNAHGAGNIRQRKDGRWEGRITVGRDPGTGKQVRRSVYGATQAEVVKAIQCIQAEREAGTYTEPTKMTVGEWADIWGTEYLNSVSEATASKYSGIVRNHIKPALGKTAIQKLVPHQVQKFYNELQTKRSAKFVRDVNGVLHSLLEQALKNGYIKTNPCAACNLPRWKRPEIQVLDDEFIPTFLEVIQDNPYRAIFFVALFTGMRQSELLGLPWENVDFNAGTIKVSQQLLKKRDKDDRGKRPYYIGPTKNNKTRVIKPAPAVMDMLRQRQREQTEQRLKAGPCWENQWNLVFTNDTGKHHAHNTVRNNFNEVVKGKLNRNDLHFHSTRHSFAVISLISGDDVKTVQENMGHHTAAFTLDNYAHVTQRMQEESSKRMERYISSLAQKEA